ncbi:hypothetical protein ACOME3_010348 [Neoechinorhynchus agilis]
MLQLLDHQFTILLLRRLFLCFLHSRLALLLAPNASLQQFFLLGFSARSLRLPLPAFLSCLHVFDAFPYRCPLHRIVDHFVLRLSPPDIFQFAYFSTIRELLCQNLFPSRKLDRGAPWICPTYLRANFFRPCLQLSKIVGIRRRIIASEGLLPVVECGVLRLTSRNHQRLVFLWSGPLFSTRSFNVWTNLFAKPFVCRWYGLALMCVMHSSMQNFRKAAAINYGPLSLTICFGEPHIANIPLNFLTSDSDVHCFAGITSGHLL